MTEMHLETEALAAYVERSLDGSRRDAVEGHLVECGACREEVIGVARVVHRGVRRWWRRWRAWLHDRRGQHASGP